MAGGHFETSVWNLKYLKEEIEQVLATPYYEDFDDLGYIIQVPYSPEVIKAMQESVQVLDKLFHVVKALDYYLEGDLGDASFVERIKEYNE